MNTLKRLFTFRLWDCKESNIFFYGIYFLGAAVVAFLIFKDYSVNNDWSAVIKHQKDYIALTLGGHVFMLIVGMCCILFDAVDGIEKDRLKG